jgi:hypothetical protein
VIRRQRELAPVPQERVEGENRKVHTAKNGTNLPGTLVRNEADPDDPDQTVNVAADPAYAEAKARMSAQLMDTLKQAGDPRLSEAPPFEQSPYTDAGEPKGGKKKNKGKDKAK